MKVTVLANSALENTFKMNKNSAMNKIWNTKMLPFKDKFFRKTQDGVDLILKDPSYALFNSLPSIKTFPEYQECRIIDIKQAITEDRYFSYLSE